MKKFHIINKIFHEIFQFYNFLSKKKNEIGNTMTKFVICINKIFCKIFKFCIFCQKINKLKI